MSKESIRLVQLVHPHIGRKIAFVREPSLELILNATSIYELALESIQKEENFEDAIFSRLSGELLDYTAVYENRDSWKLLPSFDHPRNSSECLVSGTGLTHKNSALNRQMMHQAVDVKPTDSMLMYQWGVEGGHPADTTIGVQPEWFYKGTGDMLRATGEALELPWFGDDGGEEPEVAGVYLVDSTGKPWRIGFTTGNEFSDHVMEKKNYLYLAPSKLRNCAIGPELVINADFQDIKGSVSISRNETIVWSSEIRTGEKNMAHSLANLEHHHFKYPGHRLPFQAHIHFFGADAFSFGNKVQLEDGDLMMVQWEGLGRPLINRLQVSKEEATLQKVESIL